jgi:hypothetical protein
MRLTKELIEQMSTVENKEVNNMSGTVDGASADQTTNQTTVPPADSTTDSKSNSTAEVKSDSKSNSTAEVKSNQNKEALIALLTSMKNTNCTKKDCADCTLYDEMIKLLKEDNTTIDSINVSACPASVGDLLRSLTLGLSPNFKTSIPLLTENVGVYTFPTDVPLIDVIDKSDMLTINQILTHPKWKEDLFNFRLLEGAILLKQYWPYAGKSTTVEFNTGGLVLHKDSTVPTFPAVLLPELLSKSLGERYPEPWKQDAIYKLVKINKSETSCGWTLTL